MKNNNNNNNRSLRARRLDHTGQGFDDPFFDGFNSKTVSRGIKTIIAFWVLMVIFNLVLLGVVIWGIIALVNHFA